MAMTPVAGSARRRVAIRMTRPVSPGTARQAVHTLDVERINVLNDVARLEFLDESGAVVLSLPE